MSINGKPALPPNLPETFELFDTDLFARLRVAMPGEIISYDPVKRTAQVRMLYNRVYNDGTVQPVQAPLVDVPVFTLQGGGIHIGMPIQPDDECLVVFNDFNIDNWHAYGGQQTPPDARRHDLSDGFALVGINSIPNPVMTALGPSEGGISGTTAKVAIDADTELITIANGPAPANNLNGILQALLAALAADTALNPATKTAASTAAAQLAGLLY